MTLDEAIAKYKEITNTAQTALYIVCVLVLNAAGSWSEAMKAGWNACIDAIGGGDE